MDVHQRAQRLYQCLLHNVAFAHVVTDGGEVVDVPQMPPEQATGALQEFLLHHLTGRQEALVYMICHFPLVHGRKRHALQLAVEHLAAQEDGLHGVDAGAADDPGEEAAAPLHLPHAGIQRTQDDIGVFQAVQALEFVNDEDEAGSPVLRQGVGEAEHGLHIGRIQFPVQGQDLVLVRVVVGVEDKVGASQEFLRKGGIVAWGRRHHAQHGIAQAEQEGFGGADIQGGELPHRKHLARHAHGEQGLLHQRGLSALGRLAQQHVLSLAQEVSQQGDIGPSPYEVLAGYILCVGKCSIYHYSAVSGSSTAGSAAASTTSSTCSWASGWALAFLKHLPVDRHQ